MPVNSDQALLQVLSNLEEVNFEYNPHWLLKGQFPNEITFTKAKIALPQKDPFKPSLKIFHQQELAVGLIEILE